MLYANIKGIYYADTLAHMLKINLKFELIDWSIYVSVDRFWKVIFISRDNNLLASYEAYDDDELVSRASLAILKYRLSLCHL